MSRPSQPIYEKIKNTLREKIISEEIESGSRITIQEIAKKYGVSQMPVREALQWLQGEGLLKIIPHKGARVNRIDAQLIKNLYEIRGAIEMLLIKKSFSRISEKELEDLEKKQEDLKKALDLNDLDQVLKMDREIHLSIYKYSRNNEAIEIYDKYSELLGALRKKYGLGGNRKMEIIEQHRKIIKAIKEKDPDSIEVVIRSHNENAKKDLLLQMSLKNTRSVNAR